MKSLPWLVFLVACSGGSRPDPETLFEDACEPTACATGAAVSDTPGLLAQIEAVSAWTAFGEYTSGCLTASDNIPVIGTVTITSAEVAGSAACLDEPACDNAVELHVRGTVPGVECIGGEDYFDFSTCAELRLTDTTIRLRTVNRDIHPAPGNFVPLVEVLGACESACGETELACVASHTCWSSVRDHCAYCLGGSNDQCACWDGEQLAADGTPCQRFVSGDVVVGGTCQQGTCVE
jgi:hypothetical protein